MIVLSKECINCFKTLPIELFHKDKTCKDGHKSRCKICLSERTRAKMFDISSYYNANGKFYLKSRNKFIKTDDDHKSLRELFNNLRVGKIDVWVDLNKNE